MSFGKRRARTVLPGNKQHAWNQQVACYEYLRDIYYSTKVEWDFVREWDRKEHGERAKDQRLW